MCVCWIKANIVHSQSMYRIKLILQILLSVSFPDPETTQKLDLVMLRQSGDLSLAWEGDPAKPGILGAYQHASSGFLQLEKFGLMNWFGLMN